MTCPATIRIGGFLGMTLACKKPINHKGAHEARIPSDIQLSGTHGKWVAKIELK